MKSNVHVNCCNEILNFSFFVSVKPIIDVVQILINDDGLFNVLVNLPEKANFIGTVTTLVTNSHFNEIRGKWLWLVFIYLILIAFNLKVEFIF